MDVFSETEMEDARILNTPDMVRFSSNVSMMNRSCEHIVVIRGVSPFRGTTYSNAGFYVDDVSYPLHYAQNIDFFDLERAEILKGPQGTLYGRNSESGVISIFTKQPDNHLSGKILAEYGDYNSFRTVANVSGPVVEDELFLGGAFQYRSSNGYVENETNGNDRAADLRHLTGRATLRWTPFGSMGHIFGCGYHERRRPRRRGPLPDRSPRNFPPYDSKRYRCLFETELEQPDPARQIRLR